MKIVIRPDSYWKGWRSDMLSKPIFELSVAGVTVIGISINLKPNWYVVLKALNYSLTIHG